jgi:hypothetical protein
MAGRDSSVADRPVGVVSIVAGERSHRESIRVWDNLVVRRPWVPESVGSNPTVLTALMVFVKHVSISAQKICAESVSGDS